MATISDAADFVNAPEGATVINPATGQPMALAYKNRADVPEGAQVIGVTRPAKTLTEAYARAEAARRGEPDPLATFKVVSLPHAEGELYTKADGIYGFMKDGKEYYYTPKEFGAYGVLSTSSDSKYGRNLLVNRNLQNKDVLSAGKATKLDPDTMKMVVPDEYFGNLKNPYDGYVWAANDYIKAVNPDYTKAYNDGSYENNLNKNISAFKPDFYGEFLGYNKNGDYVYKKGNQTTIWDPTGTRQTTTYTPPEKSNLQKFAEDLGPIPTIATAIFAPEFLPLVSGAQTAIQGGDLGDVLKSAGKSYALGQLGQYGQEVGGAVNQYVDAALADLGTAGDIAGNIAGTATSGLIASRGKADPLALLQAGAVGESISSLATEIPGYDQLSDAGKRAVNNAIAAEVQGRNPTAALLSLAKAAGQSAMANATNVPTEGQAAQQQADFQKQFAQFETPTPAPATPDYAPQEMQITPENLASYQDTLSSNFQGSQWKPSTGGEYTLTGDDGSTITMHKDGTTTATAAPSENLLDTLGQKTTTTGGTTTGGTTGGGTTTGGTTTGGATPPAAAPKSAFDQLMALAKALDSEGAQTQTTMQEPSVDAAPSGAAPVSPVVNFLDDLGQKPRYLEGMDPQVAALLQQIGIDPAELMAQQEAEGGAENMGEHGEEGADTLEAPGGTGGFQTRSGIQRGLRPGTLGLAGPEVGEAYRTARSKPMSFEESVNYRLPIDDYSKSSYLKQLAKESEGALSSEWQPLVGSKQLTLSGQPMDRMGVPKDSVAYVPKANIATSDYYKGTTAPQLIAMVGADPELLNNPEYLAAAMSHELSHRAQYADKLTPASRVEPIYDLLGQLGYNPSQSVREANAFSQDIAKSLPDLTKRLGYQGFYDTKANAPLEERLADLHGWATQNNVNLARDPVFAQTALNSPERMAVFNAMSPQRAIAWNPGEAEVGKIALEDFRDVSPLTSIGGAKWAYKNLSPEQFQEQLKKRLSGMFGQ